MTAEATERIAAVLAQAAEAHHTYEVEDLGGERDEEWARWYAEYVLDHGLASVAGAPPSAGELAEILTEATEAHEREGSDRDWSEFAAERLASRLG